MEAVVIRGGQSGLAAAHALARQGAAPVVLETARLDDGRHRATLAAGLPDRRPMFTGLDGDKITWPDGSTEAVDSIILATGYRPDLPHLTHLDGALDSAGRPVTATAPPSPIPGSPSWGWSGSAACPRNRCADAAGMRNAPPGARSSTSAAGERPLRTGSTCVNIDACRM